MAEKRVVVVGTTCDYIDLLRNRHPGRAFFLTDRALRERAPEPAPPPGEEALWDLEDRAGALSALEEALRSAGIEPSGIACYDCESLPLAAEAGAWFGLPFAPLEAVLAARDKWRSKRLWRAAGVPCPEAETAASREELEALLGRIPPPVVLKPMTGAGSELVFRCGNREEALGACTAILRALAEHPDTRLYPEGGADAPSPRRHVLCERCVEGPEFSADFLLDAAGAQLVRVAKKLPAHELGTGTARAYVVPAHGETGVAPEALAALLAKAARALGFSEGIFMADFLMENGRPVLLELTPRPSGDCLPWLIEAAGGPDTLGLALDLAEGKDVSPPPLSAQRRLIGLRLFAPRRGVVAAFDTAALEADPRVRQVRLYRRPGHRVELPPADYASRVLGHALFSPTPGRALEEECDELAAKLGLAFEDAP